MKQKLSGKETVAFVKSRSRTVVSLALGGSNHHEIRDQTGVSLPMIARILNAYYASCVNKTTDRMRKEQEARLNQILSSLWKRFQPILESSAELGKSDFAVIDRMLHVIDRIITLYDLNIVNRSEDDPIDRVRLVQEMLREARVNDWRERPVGASGANGVKEANGTNGKNGSTPTLN